MTWTHHLEGGEKGEVGMTYSIHAARNKKTCMHLIAASTLMANTSQEDCEYRCPSIRLMKPSVTIGTPEQINTQIRLQTQALVHAHTQAQINAGMVHTLP